MNTKEQNDIVKLLHKIDEQRQEINRLQALIEGLKDYARELEHTTDSEELT